ncbi:MAG: DpnI domain-containing protein [Bryobacteraceae bacterium]
MVNRKRVPTARQTAGAFGELQVIKECHCPRCKRSTRTLKRLPGNSRCADVICDFCGYLAQVKTHSTSKIDEVPKSIVSAGWRPQKERMDAGIYFPLFLVMVAPDRRHSIFYLSADLQEQAMFQVRPPLPPPARREGWQGFRYNLDSVQSRFARIR